MAGRPAVHGVAVRIDASDTVTRDSVRAWCDAIGTAYVASLEEDRERGVRPHFHIHFRQSTVKAIHIALLERWPELDRTGKPEAAGQKRKRGGLGPYSCTPVKKEENYDKYILKGPEPTEGAVPRPPDVVGYYGIVYTEAYVKSLYGVRWVELAAGGRNVNVQAVINKEVNQLEEKTLEAVAEIVVNAYADAKRDIDKYKLANVTAGVMAHHVPAYRESLTSWVVNHVRLAYNM